MATFIGCVLSLACVHCVLAPPPKPVAFTAQVPERGVGITDKLVEPIMQANIDYLLTSFDVNHLLLPFRQRAGLPAPPGSRAQVKGWDTDLRGSNAGRFLMGAGNTLRWIEDRQLRTMMDEVVDGVAACRNQSNGYIFAFPPENFLHSEQGNYGRSWFTQGMIEAGKAGNRKVWPLLRGTYDWFNDPEQNPYLPYLYDSIGNGEQGQIASTRMYLETPVGVYKDSQVAQDTYRDNFWMQQLIARDPTSISDYHMPAPHKAHCYEITAFLSMFDNYRATHNATWLEAAMGAWELIAENFVNIDGSSALKEGSPNHPAKSYPLVASKGTGETCCTAFWIKFNQRFHLLRPHEERYMAQIETAIYNALLRQMGQRPKTGEQDGSLPPGIRYWAPLQGVIGPLFNINTCCEGQGTRAIGSIPEYIYSLTPGGVYVNLFMASSIEFNVSMRSGSVYPEEELNEQHPAEAPNVQVSPNPPLRFKLLESHGYRPNSHGQGADCSGSLTHGGKPPPCPKNVQSLEECKQLCLSSEQPKICMGLTWFSGAAGPVDVENRCKLYRSIDLSAKAFPALDVEQWLVVGRRVPTEIDYNASLDMADNVFQHSSEIDDHVSVTLTMDTDFPRADGVSLRVSWSNSSMFVPMKLWLRMPSWLSNAVTVNINGKPYAHGKPGSYLVIDRTWSMGDVITLILFRKYRFSLYEGVDQVKGFEGKRYALLVGPIVLACIGPMGVDGTTVLPVPAGNAHEWLIPSAKPMHFNIKGVSRFMFKPLWAVDHGEHFTVYPIYNQSLQPPFFI